ncbi:unnamed protein product [Enterobius vermicularis]|uniref:Secreted protein n=1 Tax=Enterobius vermicularis TaxID=51028 RepID=A0A0N4V6D1_ENTVE|nr:unnamed protein product [Enterobius vermicularis]
MFCTVIGRQGVILFRFVALPFLTFPKTISKTTSGVQSANAEVGSDESSDSDDVSFEADIVVQDPSRFPKGCEYIGDNECACKTDSDEVVHVPCNQSSRIKRGAQKDPVAEKAKANYRKVVDELNEKFKGLKEGCFPRPKGCLCVIGKDRDGRDITERRMKDEDCKCKPGERGNGCPAPGA